MERSQIFPDNLEVKNGHSLDRIHLLDIIRGFALLGLVPMNILAFSSPLAAYFNPQSYQAELWVTHLSHIFTHVVFNQKMMGLFSFLFGVGVYIFAESNKQKDRIPSMSHYARNIWLMVFGFLHATFIWSGDILFIYAVIALVLYPFRFLTAWQNIVIAVLLYIAGAYVIHNVHLDIAALTVNELSNLSGFWSPSIEQMAEETSLYLGSYENQLMFRVDEFRLQSLDNQQIDWLMNQTIILAFIRTFALMLAGLAFAKWRFWEWDLVKLAIPLGVTLVVVGWCIAGIGLSLNYANQWQLNWGVGWGSLFNWFATPMLVVGYILLIGYFITKTKAIYWNALRCVGRMALTNYLLQSILMTSVFYGFGLGLFGQLDRLQLWLVILLVWIIQLCFSVLWLSLFRLGPFEWLWRLLTRFKLP